MQKLKLYLEWNLGVIVILNYSQRIARSLQMNFNEPITMGLTE